MGVWGSAGSCWGPGDRAGAGSCCMDHSTVSILGFELQGREGKRNEKQAPEASLPSRSERGGAHSGPAPREEVRQSGGAVLGAERPAVGLEDTPRAGGRIGRRQDAGGKRTVAEPSGWEAVGTLAFEPGHRDEPQVALLWKNSRSNGRAVTQTEVFTQ